MPLVLKVQTELDESSLSDVTRTAHDVFDGLGRDLGPVLAQGLEYGLGGALRGVTSELGTFGKAAESALSSIPAGASAAALGIGGIVVAAAAAGKALYDLGATWDDIADSITMATGKTGAELESLQKVVGDVGSMTAASLADIGKVVEQLSQQFPNLDANGESIRLMASNLAYLKQSGQDVNIHELGLAMRVFGVSAESGTKALDDFAAVARATGTPINTIISEVRSGAPIFKQFGLDMGEASAYLASFDSAGVDAGSTMTGLRAALVSLGGDSRGAREALQDTIVEIKRLSDAGDETAARQLAIETFGKRAFAPMLEAIETGALDLDKLNKALDGTQMSLQEMQKATGDAKESWQELTNTMQTRFKPVGDVVFSAVNDAAQLLTGHLNEIQGGFKVTADRAGDLKTQLDQIVELQKQFTPDSPLGRMLAPAGVPGAPTRGGLGASGGIGASGGAGRDLGLGVNEGFGGFYSLPKPAGGSDSSSTSAAGGPKPAGIDVAIPYAPDFGNGPKPGETTQQYSARTSLLEAQHRAAEELAKLNQMEASGVATQNDIINQRNKVLEAERAKQQAEMRLDETYKTQIETTTKGMETAAQGLDQLGASLDKDLGLSKGLPGLADNLVRFLGSLAAAPIQGMLGAVSAAQGGPGATGSGLIGMAGAMGAFGPQYQVGGYDASGKPISMAAMQGAGVQQGGAGGRAGFSDAALLTGVPSGQYETPRSGAVWDLTKGLGDCSSAVEDLVNIMDGRPTGGRSMATGNASEWLSERGFMPTNRPMPGSFQVGFSPSHMQATLPGGTPFNWGSDSAAANRGVGGSGAWDPSFNQHYYRPVGPGYGPLSPAQLTNPGLIDPSMLNYGGQPQVHDAGLSGPPLPPGITVVQNNTGKNEHVATPEQITAVSNFGKAMAPNPMSGTQAENVGTGATQIGGTEPKSQSGASAGGGGGLFGAAVGAGAMAADAFAPGSGAAVQIAGQEIQRAIKAGGQFAGIVAGGLMETFLPAGASQIANDNWITRVGGAFAGLAPQLPNMAGKAPTPVPNKAPGQPAMPVFPGTPGTDKPKDGASPTFNVTLNANGPIEDKHVDQMTGALQRQYETGMAQVGGR